MLELTLDTSDLDRAFDELSDELGQVARGMSVELWNMVLARTPQFAGRMAASWTYSLNAPVFVDRSGAIAMELDQMPSHLVGTDPYTGDEVFGGRKRGDPEAIALANFASYGAEVEFKLGMTIWMANGVDHGEGAYSDAVETGKVRLRSVNRPGAPMQRSVDTINSRYGIDVSPGVAARLKSLRIGER